jgi:hypothetical protein
VSPIPLGLTIPTVFAVPSWSVLAFHPSNIGTVLLLNGPSAWGNRIVLELVLELVLVLEGLVWEWRQVQTRQKNRVATGATLSIS